MHPYLLTNKYKLNHRHVQNQPNSSLYVSTLYYMWRKSRSASERRFWVRPWIERRVDRGMYHNLVQELLLEAPEDFYGFLHMCPAMFQEILQRVSPRVTKVSLSYAFQKI